MGRGQDRESLTQFITTIAQTMGPEDLLSTLIPVSTSRDSGRRCIDTLSTCQEEQQPEEETQRQVVPPTNSLGGLPGQLKIITTADPSKNRTREELTVENPFPEGSEKNLDAEGSKIKDSQRKA